MRIIRIIRTAGLTIVELVLCIALLAIISTIAISVRWSSIDGEKYEATRAKMERIRRAIMGTESHDTKGQRSAFGYVGDVGEMPASLDALITKPGGVAAFMYDTSYGIGAGWRGPYYTALFVGEPPIEKDSWGNSFIYDPSASPPSLTSQGSDKAVGGSSYATDLTMMFSTSEYIATVRGRVMDGKAGLAGRTVVMRYPSSGAFTSKSAISDVSGLFSLTGIPMGVRAIEVSTPPTLGPTRLVVDNGEMAIEHAMLNYHGDLQRVFYTPGSALVSGVNNEIVDAMVDSTYDEDVTLDTLTLWWNATINSHLIQIRINGTTQNVSPDLLANCAEPGDILGSLTQVLTIPKQSTGVGIRFVFCRKQDCTLSLQNPGMSATVLTAKFQWSNSQIDTITFAVP